MVAKAAVASDADPGRTVIADLRAVGSAARVWFGKGAGCRDQPFAAATLAPGSAGL
jgi:hypothetical protein